MEITVRPSSNFTRIFEILQYQEQKYPNPTALNAFGGGRWNGISIGDVRKASDSIAAWFISNGFQKDEKIIFMPLSGSPAWMMVDFGCQKAALVSVPVHPTSKPEELMTILKETGARLFIAANAELAVKHAAGIKKSGSAIRICHLEKGKEDYFDAMENPVPESDALGALASLASSISSNDVFTIMYTSGSSGVPKGAMLTHNNVVHNINAILTILPLEPGQRVISYLPFSHILERAACYTYMAFGASLYFSQGSDTFAHDFRTVRPYLCTSVPRVLEKMHDFLEELAMKKGPLSRAMIRWAMEVGKQYQYGTLRRPLFALKLFVARLLVLGQWRRMLGGHIRYMVVGAASLRPEIGKLFSSAGVQIVEGYGMTETAPLITINRFEPGLNRFGTVGMTIPGIEVRIDILENDEGEIFVKGPNVMKGYFKQPELTREAFTEDGWFRTGDIGKFVDRRFLKITDRKKDIFKTSSGKYVTPLPLQNHFATSPFILRCLIIGFQKPYVTALVVPNFPMLQAWCEQEKIHWTSPPFMIHNIKVRAKIKSEVDRLNEDLANFQRVRDFVLCEEDWTVESGDITATLKPVRHRLMDHHQAEIERMYENNHPE